MRLRQGFLVVALVCFGVIGTHADGVPSDARIIVGHGGDPKPVGPSFLVPVDQTSGGGVVDFENGSSTQNIIELIFTGKLNKKDTVVCASDDFYFGSCSVIPGNGNKITIIFDDPLSGGIPPGGDFFVGLNNVGKKTGSWKADGIKDLDAEAIFASVSVPEPGTLLFLLSGLGGIWLRRRREPLPKTHF